MQDQVRESIIGRCGETNLIIIYRVLTFCMEKFKIGKRKAMLHMQSASYTMLKK